MMHRILAWLLIGNLVSGVAYAGPKGAKPHKPAYHCMCGDICVKVAPGERCKLKSCNGKDVRGTKAGKEIPD